MRLKIDKIIERGVAGRERLQLSVLADADLSFYAVFDTVYIGQEIATLPKRTYWFSSCPVKAGDKVILYTGPGSESVQRRQDGFNNYFYHWGLKQTIWNRPEDCAVLVEFSSWETTPKG